MPLWRLWFRNQAVRWVYCYHQTSTFSGLVHLQLLLGLDQCVVNPFPERTHRFGSSSWPTSNLSKRCGAPPARWRHCILPDPRPSTERKTHLCQRNLLSATLIVFNVKCVQYQIHGLPQQGGLAGWSFELPSNQIRFLRTQAEAPKPRPVSCRSR